MLLYNTKMVKNNFCIVENTKLSYFKTKNGVDIMIKFDEITIKKGHLQTAINAIKSKVNLRKDDLKPILEKLKEYILKVMERDIPHVNINTRQQLANYIIDCVNEGWRKGYFTSDNINDAMAKLINSCNEFYEITDALTYGRCASGHSIGFNFENNFAISNMKEIIFHELIHAVAPLNNLTLGFYKENSQNDRKEVKGFSTIRNSQNYITIITDYMTDFLREIIAEATACDLAEAYKPTKEEVCHGITSDWVAIYNRSYQQLGYEFLKTLKYDNSKNERELFKELTIKAINGEDIGREILRIYQEKNPDAWKEDLHEITTTLGEIAAKHNLSSNIEKVNRARELMKKYTPAHFMVVSRTDISSSNRRR